MKQLKGSKASIALNNDDGFPIMAWRNKKWFAYEKILLSNRKHQLNKAGFKE